MEHDIVYRKLTSTEGRVLYDYADHGVLSMRVHCFECESRLTLAEPFFRVFERRDHHYIYLHPTCLREIAEGELIVRRRLLKALFRGHRDIANLIWGIERRCAVAPLQTAFDEYARAALTGDYVHNGRLVRRPRRASVASVHVACLRERIEKL